MAHIATTDRSHAVRMPDDLWSTAQEIAESHGETLSEVIRRLLRDYVAETPRRSRVVPWVEPEEGKPI